MFGLSIKEKLSKIILKASVDFIENFKSNLNDDLILHENLEKDEFETLFIKARNEYLDEVANAVFGLFQKSAPEIYCKINLYLQNTSICGYEINLENSIMAGPVYALCYYACKNKIASAKHCISLNQVQNSIIDKALLELPQNKNDLVQMLKNENKNIKNKIKMTTTIFIIILLAVITFFSYFLFKKDGASKENFSTASSQPTFVEPLTDRNLIIYKTKDNDYYHLDKNCEDSPSYYVAYLGEALDDDLSICPKCESKLLNEAIEVYYTETGTVIHQSLDCQYLKNSDKIYSSLLSDKSDQKKCSKCWWIFELYKKIKGEYYVLH